MALDGAAVGVDSACAAAVFVLWLSIVVSVRKRPGGGAHASLLSLLVLPAPLFAWRAGLKARAVAMAVLLAIYLASRVVFG